MTHSRIHFILVNEGFESDKITNFLYYGLRLYLETDIFRYDCFYAGDDREEQYNLWFTDIMLSRGHREVILVKHQEIDNGIALEHSFHRWLHVMNARIKHFISLFNINTRHNIGDESRFVLMVRQIMPSIQGDFSKLLFGNPQCHRYLDFDHVPDNPGMHFDY